MLLSGVVCLVEFRLGELCCVKAVKLRYVALGSGTVRSVELCYGS